MPKLYVKSMDGCRWYVGDEPCRPERSIGFQLGRYFYASDERSSNENLSAARSYARALVIWSKGEYQIADYGMNEAAPALGMIQ